jgi:hypothetical protein
MKKIRLIILAGAMMISTLACTSNPKKAENPSATETEFADKGQYTCPMHSEVINDGPGACPKCGMKLEKVVDSTSVPVVDSLQM